MTSFSRSLSRRVEHNLDVVVAVKRLVLDVRRVIGLATEISLRQRRGGDRGLSLASLDECRRPSRPYRPSGGR
jgi:hypothetical protein